MRNLKHPLAGAAILLVILVAAPVWLVDDAPGIALAFAALTLSIMVGLVVLSRLAATMRSLDRHIGATRQQMRIAIDQALAGPSSAEGEQDEIAPLADRLWAGFEQESAAQLERMVYGLHVGRATRSEAAAALSIWQYVAGSPADAHRTIALTRLAPVSVDRQARDVALEADYLVALGRLLEARALLLGAGSSFADTEAWFRLANTYDPRDALLDDQRLHHVNSAFVSASIAPLERRSSGARLSLSNLQGRTAPRSVEHRDDPLVSVIMPMRDAEATVGYALRSVLEQTWCKLQVVVVDDGSDDATTSIVESVAASDPRVELHRRARQGAYVARNFGLSHCKGDYVTVHDADDWSHPEKIERQVRAMQESGGKRASWSFWIRCSDDLTFCPPSLRAQYRQIAPNFSSFMVHRSVFDDLGTWDEAVVSSDAEFIRRFKTFEGPESVVSVLPTVPLAFGLRSDRSLTGDGSAGVLTLYHIAGARRQYREAYTAWHRRRSFRETLPFDPRRELPFCRPALLDPKKRQSAGSRDVVIVGDFSTGGRRGDALELTAGALAERGLRVGLVHVPIGRSSSGPSPEVIDALDGERLRVVSSGETIDVGLVLVDDAELLRAPLTGAPHLVARNTLILVRRRLDGLPAAQIAASLASFGIASGWWQVTNPTFTPTATQLVAELGPGQQLEPRLWRDLVLPACDIARGGAPEHVRIRVVGVAQDARSGWVRTHLRTLEGRVTLEEAVPAHNDCDNAAEPREATFDLAILTGDGEVAQDDVLSVLRAAVPIVADPLFRSYLGSAASYADESTWAEAVAVLLNDASAWQGRAEATALLVAEEFDRDAVVESIAGYLTDDGAGESS